jgi:hypothetical protein
MLPMVTMGGVYLVPFPSSVSCFIPFLLSEYELTISKPEYVKISPIYMNLDYKPKKTLRSAAKKLDWLELFNFFHLEGATLSLEPCKIIGVRML